MSINFSTLTIKAAHELLKSKQVRVGELVEHFQTIAVKKNSEMNAYLEIFDDIKEQVVKAEQMYDNGQATLLTGIPIAIKDNILIEGKISSGASKILANHRAVYDATVIQKLKQQGVVFIGRTNMDEFAMGSTTENSAFGVTKNPLDTDRVAGGTSGGSAAAVAMGAAMAALGSDTGGSIRLPASFCGLVGMKPTYGAVSRYGLMATASSLDQIGVIAKNIDDAVVLYDAIQGNDPKDSTSLPDSEAGKAQFNAKKLRIGVPKAFVSVDGMDADVRKLFEQTLERYRTLGHEIVDIELPYLSYALPVYYIINPAEISANLSRYDGVRYGHRAAGDTLREVYRKSRGEGFGPEVKRRILLGTYVLSAGYYDAYYNKANTLREIIRDDFARVFQEVDLIATPTAPTPAYKIGEKSNDPLAMYLGDIFTVTANVAGLPAVSIPGGVVERDGKELPVGFQLLGPHRGEQVLFTAGRQLESVQNAV